MKQIMIAGNIGKDAVVRTTQGGDKVTGFSVAVNDRKKNTTWFDCAIWGKRGESLCQYLTKGTQVAVTGELTTREHEGKTYLGCQVSEITLMGGGEKREQRQEPGGGPDLDGDSIPFSAEWRL